MSETGGAAAEPVPCDGCNAYNPPEVVWCPQCGKLTRPRQPAAVDPALLRLVGAEAHASSRWLTALAAILLLVASVAAVWFGTVVIGHARPLLSYEGTEFFWRLDGLVAFFLGFFGCAFGAGLLIVAALGVFKAGALLYSRRR